MICLEISWNFLFLRLDTGLSVVDSSSSSSVWCSLYLPLVEEELLLGFRALEEKDFSADCLQTASMTN